VRRWLIVAVTVLVLACAAAAALVLWPRHHEPVVVRRTIAPGEKVVLRGGLSLTSPIGGDWNAYYTAVDGEPEHDASGLRMADDVVLQAPRDYGSGLTKGTLVQAMTFSDPQGWNVPTIAWGDAPPPVAYASADGAIEVRWQPSAHNRALVVAKMPDGTVTGLYFISPSPLPTTTRELSRVLGNIWRTLRVEGVSLPPVSAFGSVEPVAAR
jgi:hypothetical protein